MKKLIVIILLFICNNAFCANSITIDFITPEANQASDSTLHVMVDIHSTFEITTVTGNVSGHLGTLTYDGSQYFSGTISLSGLQKGIPLQLTVTVIDAFGNQQAVSENIIYAPPSQVHVVYPFDAANVYLGFPIKAHCTGLDTCTLHVKVTMNASTTVFEKDFTNEVDTMINIPSIYTYGSVQFRATDRWGQMVYFNREVQYNNNQWLSPVYNATGKIFDFNYNKVLVVGDTSNDQYYGPGKIIDIATNAFITPTLAPGGENYFDQLYYSFLTPYGAFFGQNQNKLVFDWNNNTIYSMVPLLDETPFDIVHTSGQYATWTRVAAPQQTEIHLRDLATGSDLSVITADGYNDQADVASNGLVAYTEGGSLSKFYNNTTTLLSQAGGNFFDTVYLNPVTDGYNILYLKEASFSSGDLLWLNDGNSNILLSDLGDIFFQACRPAIFSRLTINSLRILSQVHRAKCRYG